MRVYRDQNKLLSISNLAEAYRIAFPRRNTIQKGGSAKPNPPQITNGTEPETLPMSARPPRHSRLTEIQFLHASPVPLRTSRCRSRLSTRVVSEKVLYSAFIILFLGWPFPRAHLLVGRLLADLGEGMLPEVAAEHAVYV